VIPPSVADPACAMAHGDLPAKTEGRRLLLGFVSPVAAAPDDSTDVVVTDHDRPELGNVLAQALAAPSRWVGVMGSLRHTAPHVAALRERGVSENDIARVHRPIGLDIGSRAPAEIAVATLAGLLADRNGRPGGPFRVTA
jgi:xanthine dehydrogenase accessory factor